jgi:hypothetical protein
MEVNAAFTFVLFNRRLGHRYLPVGSIRPFGPGLVNPDVRTRKAPSGTPMRGPSQVQSIPGIIVSLPLRVWNIWIVQPVRF